MFSFTLQRQTSQWAKGSFLYTPLYLSIQRVNNNNNTTIYFKQLKSPEHWKRAETNGGFCIIPKKVLKVY